MADVEATSTTPVEARRPLSPHLGIYRLTMTMAMSIVHRLTGIALYAGTILLAWWLVALSTDAGAFTFVSRILGSIPGRLVLFGYTWTLFHHMLGGVRHLIWDTGHGLDTPTSDRIALATAVGSACLTVIVWICVYLVG